jgi:type I restriction enzyme M protein
VVGLCKLAAPADLKEQEYSLNPGRYVGVVIENDGKTEEEFISEILSFGSEIATLSASAAKLQETISANIKVITGDL